VLNLRSFRIATRRLLALAAVLAGCAACGHRDSFNAGLNEEAAKKEVHARVVRMDTADTFPYRLVEARKSKAIGRDAWLIRVPYEGDSGDACAFAWRERHGNTRVRWDGSCRHWEY